MNRNRSTVTFAWAQQSTRDAQANGTIRKVGRDLYSYATRIGTISESANGRPFAVLSRRTYSNTTATHLSFAHRAAQRAGLPVFTLADVQQERGRIDPEDLIRDFDLRLETAKRAYDRETNKRTRAYR